MKIAKFFGFINLALYILFLASVSDAANLKRDIIGKWVEKNKNNSVEFLKDGTAIFINSGQSVTTNYKFIDDKRLKVAGVGSGSDVILEASFDKEGQLNLKDPTGKIDILLITEAMAKKKVEAKVYSKQGIDYSKKEQYDLAIENYSKAISIDPNNARTYNNRGIAYRKKGQYDKGMEDFNKAISIDPIYYGPYFGRARIYSLRNDISSACDSLNKAFENADMKEKTVMKEKLNDSDFDKIRNSNCFKKIVSRIKK